MNRRHFLATTSRVFGAGLAGSLLPKVATAAPCPPSTLSVQDGSSVTTAACVASSDRTVGNEYFVMQNGSTGPLYGFPSFSGDASTSGDEVTVTRVATGGPLGRPYLRYTIDDTPLAEFGFGWFKEPIYTTSQRTWGQSVFFRFSFRAVSSYNQTQKFIILNRGSTGDERNILVVQPWADGYVWRACRDGGLDCQTDGGSWDPTAYDGAGGWVTGESAHTDLNVWSNIQWEVRFASGPTASDGYYRIWRNTNVYASPTAATGAQVGVYTTTDANPDWIGFSGYHQVIASQPRIFDIADFRVGPTFDPNWHA